MYENEPLIAVTTVVPMNHGFNLPEESTNNLVWAVSDVDRFRPAIDVWKLPSLGAGRPVPIIATLSVLYPAFKSISYNSTVTILPSFFHRANVDAAFAT